MAHLIASERSNSSTTEISAQSSATAPAQSRFPVSVVIIAKNEETNIDRCVRSVQHCDEILVVDDHSVDKTKEIAEHAGARVVNHAFESFAKQRNWALEHGGLRNAWAIMLDADEAATPEFLENIAHQIEMAGASCIAFRTCRKTILGDRWLRHADEFPCWIMRVVRVGFAAFQDSGHGEVPIPTLSGEVGTIREPFIHYPFSHGLSQWLRRHIEYASREAKLEITQDVPVAFSGLFSFNGSKRRRALRSMSRNLPMRAVLRFAYQYFLKLGFLDGKEGFIFSTLKAIYEAMIVVKKWELKTIDRFKL